MLRTENLRREYQIAGEAPLVALRGASFSVADGEVLGLLGPNGAGKTTLLRILATIIPPTSGHCWIGDRSIADNPDHIRRHIGFLSGNTKLYGRLTGAEVLRYFGRLYDMNESRIAQRTRELTQLLDMEDIIHRRCETLSTGQTQKVNLARVILHDPEVLILDEPTLGLDIITSQSIIEFIIHARERGHSIIFSTHYMDEAERLCDRIALIYKGAIMAIGTKKELFELTGADNVQDVFLSLVHEYKESDV